jgi:hypothetical protein
VLRPGAIRPATRRELIRLGQIPRRFGGQMALWRLQTKVDVLTHNPRVWREPLGLGYHGSRIPMSRSLLLHGYFQNEAYFSHCADEVGAAIALDYDSPGDSVSVSISLRRGPDYRNAGIALSWQFYRDALRALHDVIGTDYCMYVTSDKPGAVDEFVDQLGVSPARISDLSGASALRQLATIASATHAIVANSSFAWWGAWLGDQRQECPGRLVYASDPWVPGNRDVCPRRWRRIAASFD